MVTSPQPRRGNTRQRIQDVALAFFMERGYEKTSLREIADELGVTKAALYYHFKTKEDILVSLFAEVGAKVDRLIAWGREQPRTRAVKRELLSRYSRIAGDAAPLFHILQENQATLRDLSVGQDFKQRVSALVDLFKDPDAPMASQVRSVSALLCMHLGSFALKGIEGAPEDKRQALLAATEDLLDSAYP
ncbi:TetR/AcrR family transcriptional regulator [Streptomyces aidingensis]|uniref:DNA-binding transcriptional regulator, AcrR family n=1 Tax=Streptomyces aidingensis TaxID=910347 RepID=A0A1I1HN01_9ACTN|nr:TetR/AcrR family transcriptional regulator [Streptomyces aidingensis]SFC22833.1 DNA-binding transcriptional regulator, AcrR family [Streptomyces aidingensis]